MTPSKKFLIAIVFSSLVLDAVIAFEVTDCSGKDALAKLDKVTIGGCPVGTPDKYCPLVRGRTASIDVDFESGMFVVRLISCSQAQKKSISRLLTQSDDLPSIN